MEAIKEKIENLVQQILQKSDMFLVDIHVSARSKVTVFIDADNGLNISDCKSVSKQLYKAIVEQEIYEDGAFSLDVSSPGVDMPLRNMRQYKKNVGRLVKVTMEDDVSQEGRLKEVTEDHITLEQKVKKESKEVDIPFQEILETKVQIEFK